MTTEPDDGGSAFPLPFPPESRVGFGLDGMSLRDYYAGKAMEALLLAAFINTDDAGQEDERRAADLMVDMSWEVADMMIKRRRKR
jgi:hypothetical protein